MCEIAVKQRTMRVEVSADEFRFMALDAEISSSMLYWIIDLEAMQHMTPHRHAGLTLKTPSLKKIKMFMGDDGRVEAVGMGSIIVEEKEQGHTRSIRIKDVLHVPKLQGKLLTVSKLVSVGSKVHFSTFQCIVETSNEEVVVALVLENNLYVMVFKVIRGEVAALAHLQQKRSMFSGINVLAI